MTLLYDRYRHDDMFPREHCARRLRPCPHISNREPRAAVPTILELGLFGGFAFKGALEGLVEGGFGFVVFLLGDAALLVLDFEVKEFVF